MLCALHPSSARLSIRVRNRLSIIHGIGDRIIDNKLSTIERCSQTKEFMGEFVGLVHPFLCLLEHTQHSVPLSH